MQIIQEGGQVKLHSNEWVNKCSGKGEIELIVDDGNSIKKYSYPYWFIRKKSAYKALRDALKQCEEFMDDIKSLL